MRVLFVNGSGQRNMRRQRDPNFLFSLLLCTQLEVSNYVFLWLGRAWRTFLHLLGMYLYLLFQWGFLPEISIFLGPNQKCQEPKNLPLVCWYDTV